MNNNTSSLNSISHNIKEYLPVGSVVLLKNANKRLIIVGFCAISNDDENGVMYDYCGYTYPEGMINSQEIALFNHEQIAKVFFVGLSDDEEKNFKIQMDTAIKERFKNLNTATNQNNINELNNNSNINKSLDNDIFVDENNNSEKNNNIVNTNINSESNKGTINNIDFNI